MKRLRIRRADRCASCDLEMAVGTEAWWDASERCLRCLSCVALAEEPDTPAEHVAAEAGGAGASARQEYERRAGREREQHDQALADDLAWRRAAVESRPVLGRLASALRAKPAATPEKQWTTAWKTGAEGEERVAEVLGPVVGIEVLHDRRVPGSRANIDHLVVGPAGVFIVDAKKRKTGSEIEVRDVGTRRRPEVRLYIGGRNETKQVEGVRRQMEVVRTALGPELADVPLHGVLCVVGARWGWPKRTKTVGGVTAVWPRGLPDLVAREGPGTMAVERIAAHLRAALPPAGS